MELAPLLARYGYLGIFVGTFFEGETILVLAGIAAHAGYLALWGVVAAAFGGTLAGDQLYFHLGRLRGQAMLERRPAWHAPAARVQRLLRRHENLLILGFRFLYGLRTVTPFVLGASGVSPVRFALLNALSAAAWATAVALAGYALGSAARTLLGDAERYEAILFGGVALAGALLWLLHRIRRRRSGSTP